MLEISGDDGRRTLALSGELDLTSSWLLVQSLLQIGANGATTFTLDLSGLTFIDSTGVRSVLAARGLCAARGCEFRVIPGCAQVQRVFAVGGLIDRLPFAQRRDRPRAIALALGPEARRSTEEESGVRAYQRGLRGYRDGRVDDQEQRAEDHHDAEDEDASHALPSTSCAPAPAQSTNVVPTWMRHRGARAARSAPADDPTRSS
jgi:anti-anti-sigma factor